MCVIYRDFSEEKNDILNSYNEWGCKNDWYIFKNNIGEENKNMCLEIDKIKINMKVK